MPRINFIELPTTDLPATQAFYAQAFAMQMTAFGPTYACTLTGDVDLGLQADSAEATRAPLPVIQVDNLDATLAAVLAAGVRISVPIFSFPGGRRFHFVDPSGNELAAMQADAA
jgi:predicted enzyme related to lactoylglutathione lyase